VPTFVGFIFELVYEVPSRPTYAKVTAPVDPVLVTASGPCGEPVKVNEGIVRATVDAPFAIAIVKLDVVAVALFASVTVTVNEKLPAIEGVPEITPALLRVTPVGNDPVAVKTLVPAPPLAEMVRLNAVL
jgi:hypothetical protein